MDKKVFAKGLCVEKYFFMFILGSVVGAIYEDLLQGFDNLANGNAFAFNVHRGVIYGPFNVIYGFGAMIMMYFLLRHKKKWYNVFIEGALLGGSFEYIISFLYEKFLHVKSWDYSNLFLNFNGRTSIGIMFIWGLFSLVFIFFIYPNISRLIEKIPYKIGTIVYKLFFIFMAFDILISWSALIRQALRRSNIPPITVIGEIYDKYYTDEYLKQYFSNTWVVEQ